MNGTAPHFVGAMKIARNVAVSGRYVEWYAPPAPSLKDEGVSSDEWWNVKISEFS